MPLSIFEFRRGVHDFPSVIEHSMGKEKTRGACFVTGVEGERGEKSLDVISLCNYSMEKERKTDR